MRSRTLSDRTPKSERTDRLYEVALRYEPPSDEFGVEVGRIGIYRFVGIGYLDGVLGALPAAVRGVQVGAFGGRVADIESLGFDGTGQQVRRLRAPRARRAATRPAGYDVDARLRARERGRRREPRVPEPREPLRQRQPLVALRARGARPQHRLAPGGHRQELPVLERLALREPARRRPSAWAFVSYDGRRNYRYYLQPRRPGGGVRRPAPPGAAGGGERLPGRAASAPRPASGCRLKEPDPRNPELDIANAYSFNAGVRHANLFSSRLLGRASTARGSRTATPTAVS